MSYFYNGVNIVNILNNGSNSNNDNTYFVGFPSGNTSNYSGELLSIPGFTYTSNQQNYTYGKEYQANYVDYPNTSGGTFNGQPPSWCNSITVLLIGDGGGGGGGGGGNGGGSGYNNNFNAGGGGGGCC